MINTDRRFHSYGPVNEAKHFTLPRKNLIRSCLETLIDDPDDRGHYITVWAPRQTGKTWLMHQVKQEIKKLYQDRFIIGCMSVQGVILNEDDPEDKFLSEIPLLIRETFGLKMNSESLDWRAVKTIFHNEDGLFDKPVILFIDEFDSLPPKIIDRLLTIFRDMYLKKESYLIHAIAMIGVRAVLGVESDRGSPFNIQKSVHVPNFTLKEVKKLYKQYEDEAGQTIASCVIEKIFTVTQGQPGLVSWFGELLTEKYNPGIEKIIDIKVWEQTYRRACNIEWNNTLLNLIKKAKGKYIQRIIALFTKPEIPFNLRTDWCNYLYLNGIIDYTEIIDINGGKTEICRFSSPFIQTCLFNALTPVMVNDRIPITSLNPLDDISDIFKAPEIDIPDLLHRYKNYLNRLKEKGINLWKEQPRRTDMHLSEAAGHFHLYAWLKDAVEDYCIVSPEFPTGNGKVDLHLKCGEKQGIIEVKSFTSIPKLQRAYKQAAEYAESLKLNNVTIALFVPVEDDEILKKLSGTQIIGTTQVTVFAIGWI